MCEKKGKVPSLYTLFIVSVNNNLLSSKSKPKEVWARKLYGTCYPWLSCSKFNSIVQKAAGQNYEFIWFPFNQLEVLSWIILRLRETASRCMKHVFLFGSMLCGFWLPNSISKAVWESWGCVKPRTQFIQAGYTALRTYQNAKGKKVVTEMMVSRTRFSSSV